MRLSISVSDEALIICQEILSLLTNYAQIDVKKIVYNQEERWVEIPLSRRKFELKVTMFGKRANYRKERRQAILRIKQVEDFQMRVEENIMIEQNGIFTALFGLKINGHRMYLGSAEESQGKQMSEIIVQVSDIDIEIVDVR